VAFLNGADDLDVLFVEVQLVQNPPVLVRREHDQSQCVDPVEHFSS